MVQSDFGAPVTIDTGASVAACAGRQVPLFKFSTLNWVNYSLNKNTHSKCLRNALCMARLSEELEKAASDPIRAENRKSCNLILVNLVFLKYFCRR